MFYESLEVMIALAESEASVLPVSTDGHTTNGGTYSKAVPTDDSAQSLMRFILDSKPPFDPAELRDEAHVTLVYSKEKSIDLDKLKMNTINLSARVTGVEYWDGHNNTGYVVAKLASDTLPCLHQSLKDAGAQHSFPEYSPHMTIGAKVGAKTPEMAEWVERANGLLKVSDLPMTFKSVVVEDIDESR